MDSTRANAAPASSNSSSFSATFSSASAAAHLQKAQEPAKQGSEKKAAKEKTASTDSSSPSPSSTPVNAWIAQPPVQPVQLGIPTAANAPEGNKGDTGTNDHTTAGVQAVAAEQGASLAAAGSPVASVDASEILSGNGGPAAAAVAGPTDQPAVAEGDGPGGPADEKSTDDSKDLKAAVSALVQQVQPQAASVPVAGEKASDTATAAPATEQTDATAQAQALAAAQPAPVPQAAPGQPWDVAAGTTVKAADAAGASSLKVQPAAVSGSDMLTKQAAGTGKDRGGSQDVRGKRKSDDDDATPSDAKTDGSFAMKIPVQMQDANAQTGASPHHGADTQAVQQAMQAAAIPGNGSPAPSVGSPADNSANAAQTAAPANTASPHAATEAQTLPAVNSAHLIQSMGQSEMKLGMHSTEFGSISINTSVTHEVLSAEISTSHAALGQALTVHLPSIEERLGNTYGLQARVEVRDSNSGASGDTTQQSRDGRQGQGNGSRPSPSSSFTSSGMSFGAPVQSASLSLGSSRLDIRI